MIVNVYRESCGACVTNPPLNIAIVGLFGSNGLSTQ